MGHWGRDSPWGEGHPAESGTRTYSRGALGDCELGDDLGMVAARLSIGLTLARGSLPGILGGVLG